ncbi:O-antigen ligase [Geodermatophilus telluris]|uniref:O-antigen ligase n=1 Tax=Geodermatophilus telluris TaxID=1190417 RepID=A0A1G6L5X3_9ACTN|nr:O-antigen ligase family protein [Geodermatophilus telluris]SDC38513.1 O-antigen ligase [Geodermatophilus telluris]
MLLAALAPLLVAYAVACFRDPLRWALPAYAVSIPFSSLLSFGAGPFSSASSLLGLLLGVALLTQLITTRRSSPRLSLAIPVWLAFLALCGLSVFWSISPSVTVKAVAVFASLVLLFFALALTRFDRASLRRFESALLVGGILVVCYGAAQLLFLGGLPSLDGKSARLGNDLLDPNNQAAALLLPLALAAGRSLAGERTWRLLHGAAALVLVGGILMTGSRGGLLASVVVVSAVLLLGAGSRLTRATLGAAAGVVLAVVLILQPAGIGQRQVQDTLDSSGRTDIWTVGLHACQVYCLTGAGWGGFPVVYREQLVAVPEARFSPRGTMYQPHNIFLLALVEAGVLGLVLVALGLGVALVSALRLPRDMRGPPAAAMLGTLVSSFFLSNLEFKFFWALLAYIAISVVLADDQRLPPAHPRVLRRFPITGSTSRMTTASGESTALSPPPRAGPAGPRSRDGERQVERG